MRIFAKVLTHITNWRRKLQLTNQHQDEVARIGRPRRVDVAGREEVLALCENGETIQEGWSPRVKLASLG
jgi:hypothetical protein